MASSTTLERNPLARFVFVSRVLTFLELPSLDRVVEAAGVTSLFMEVVQNYRAVDTMLPAALAKTGGSSMFADNYALECAALRVLDRPYKCFWMAHALAQLCQRRQKFHKLLLRFAARDMSVPHLLWNDIHDDVTQLRWQGQGIAGVVDLCALPRCLTVLYLYQNQLRGAIDLRALPPTLVSLGLSTNFLSGPVDLTQLPATLTALSLSQNQLSGSLTLDSLPAGMKTLHLDHNQFTGPCRLGASLPRSLTKLHLNFNLLQVAVDTEALPRELVRGSGALLYDK